MIKGERHQQAFTLYTLLCGIEMITKMLRINPALRLRPVSILSKRALTTTRFNLQTKIALNEDPTPKIEPQDEIPTSYPDVKPELYYNRDPYGDWDDVQNRRNINEPLHEDEDVLNLWSPEYYQYVSDGEAFKLVSYFFLGVAGIFGVCYTFFYPKRIAVPRNYPHDGLSKALGARNSEEAELLGARVDKTAY